MKPSEFEKACGFELDPYQVEAIEHLREGSSVLVAAPTGSGKTVIAEYALALAGARKEKFFYTTPLKALSNQKFRDLSRAAPPGWVGLLTGDNSINGDAPVVVMTTEVLRNMIYENSPVLERLGVVVLDEVHYMQDPFRGAVWEEIVIQLPSRIRLVALSATISNAADLGAWIDSLRGDTKVVASIERPVKLENHYFVGRAMEPLFSRGLHRVVAEQVAAIEKARAAERGRKGRRRVPDARPRRTEVIKELDRREMLPAIYFLFSRAACDDSVALWVREGKGLIGPREAEWAASFIDDKVSALDPADLECLNYGGFRDALVKGVASHHAGQLPLFKEAVEELFTAGLIKVVFATETLSLGINMPARTVVIESLTKWTGEKHRPLTAGEYKQLTGRAGRRGIDEVGYAVVLHQRYFNPDHIRALVKREPDPVVSSFQVTYNMAVNILAVHDMEQARRIINLSFAQYMADRRVVGIEARLERIREDLEKDLEAARCGEADAAVYRSLEKRHSGLSAELSALTKEKRHSAVTEAISGLQPGDVFTAGHGDSPRVVAVVKKPGDRRGEPGVLVVDSAGRYRRLGVRSMTHPPRVIGAVDVSRVTSPTRKVRRRVGSQMEALGREEGDLAPGLVMSDAEETIFAASREVRKQLEGHPCHRCQHRDRCLEAARRAERLERRRNSTRRERDSGHELVSRRLTDVVEVLNRLGFLEDEKPTVKGAVLRRVYNECDLLLVEALDRGIFSDLQPQEVAALASWFIYESRDGDEARERGDDDRLEHLRGKLRDVLSRLEVIHRGMKEVEAQVGLDLLGFLDTGFGEIAYAWSGGLELEGMLERFPGKSIGDMVRTMKQILDLLRQLAEVAQDPSLSRSLEAAMRSIDRGVVGYSSIESILEHEIENPWAAPAGAESETNRG